MIDNLDAPGFKLWKNVDDMTVSETVQRSYARSIQGFPQFCRVADIFLKASDVTFFGVTRRLASAEGGGYLGW